MSPSIPNLKPSALSQLVLVRRFPADVEIRRLQFEFEDRFKEEFSQPAQALPVAAGTPPDQPRFILASGTKFLVVSALSVNLVMNFDSRPQARVIEIVSKYARKLDSALDEILKLQSQWYAGIVATIVREAVDGIHGEEAIARYLGSALCKLDPDYVERLSSTVLSLSVVEADDYFKLFELSSARTYIGSFPAGTQTMTIDPDYTEPNGVSLQIKVDVNSKPKRKSPSPGEFSRLVPLLEQALKIDVQRLLSPDILDLQV